jgi:nucleotide-binding universal stress UspA family protein
VTRTGTAVQEVIAVADDCDADVIIVGSRGRGPVTSRLFGSVARGLVHKSRRPVTVVTATTHTSAPG